MVRTKQLPSKESVLAIRSPVDPFRLQTGEYVLCNSFIDSDVCRRFIGEPSGLGEQGDTWEFVEAE